MSNLPLKEKRRSAVGNYLASIVTGLLTLTFGTVAVNLGFIPLLTVKVFGTSDWIALCLIAVFGWLAYEGSLYFRIFSEKVVEHRKQLLADRKRKPK